MVRPDLLQGWQPQPEGPGEEPSDCAVIGGAVEELELDPPRANGIVAAAATSALSADALTADSIMMDTH